MNDNKNTIVPQYAPSRNLINNNVAGPPLPIRNRTLSVIAPNADFLY